MNKLLRMEIFDNFLLQEAVITKAASYVIDGHLQKGFYSSTELEENGIAGYSILPFRMLRTNCFDLIKGRQTPSSFKFVFCFHLKYGAHPKQSALCFHRVRYQWFFHKYQVSEPASDSDNRNILQYFFSG